MYIEVPIYDGHGLNLLWEENFCIECRKEGTEIVLSANEAGLISLARILLELSQNPVPSGSHVHLDEYNALEPGSLGLIVSKI